MANRSWREPADGQTGHHRSRFDHRLARAHTEAARRLAGGAKHVAAHRFFASIFFFLDLDDGKARFRIVSVRYELAKEIGQNESTHAASENIGHDITPA